MFKQKKNQGKTCSLPSSFLMFGMFVLGAIAANCLLRQHPAGFAFSSLRRSFWLSMGRSAICIALILLLSKFKWGVFVIPLFVAFKAFAYSVAIHALMSNTVLGIAEMVSLYVPAAISTSGLLYLSSVAFVLSLYRRKQRIFSEQRAREVKGAVFFAFLCSTLGSAAEIILQIS